MREVTAEGGFFTEESMLCSRGEVNLIGGLSATNCVDRTLMERGVVTIREKA